MLGLLPACGDGLVGGAYRGEPLITVSGKVLDDPNDPFSSGVDDGTLRITLRWAQWSGLGTGALDDQEIEALTSFPANYEMNIYQPPPAEARFDPPWDATDQIAVGVPLLYSDKNRDGVWDTDEQLVGGPFDLVIVYLESIPDLDASDTALWDSGNVLQNAEPGYHVMSARVDYCSGGASAGAALAPVDRTTVDLWLGTAWEDIVQLDCRGDL